MVSPRRSDPSGSRVAPPDVSATLGRLGVDVLALALPYGALVPAHAEPGEVGEDRLLPTMDDTRGIGVVDPQNEAPTLLVGEPTIRDGHQRVPQMERTGRARREPDADAHASIVMCPGSAATR